MTKERPKVVPKRYTRCYCQDGDMDYFDKCCMEKYYDSGEEIVIEEVRSEQQAEDKEEETGEEEEG